MELYGEDAVEVRKEVLLNKLSKSREKRKALIEVLDRVTDTDGKKYIYCILEGKRYEPVDETLLSHKNAYTEEEFNKIVEDAFTYLKETSENDYFDTLDIERVLVEMYGFNDYRVEVQAGVYRERWDRYGD